MERALPPAAGHVSSPHRPRLTVPAGACDCHMHVYGPVARFPYAPSIKTPPLDVPLEAYLALRQRLGLQRTVFVQPSAYGADNACALDAIARTAPNGRGIAVIDPAAPEAEIARLHAAGMRGVRFHDMVAGCLPFDVLEPVAARIAPHGWHVQIQLDGDRLVDLAPRLAALPVDVVIDHMGRIPIEHGTARAAFKILRCLLDSGRCWVKLSAPYHVSRAGPPDYRDCATRAPRPGSAPPPNGCCGEATGRIRAFGKNPMTPTCSTSLPTGPATARHSGKSWSTTRPSCSASERPSRRLSAIVTAAVLPLPKRAVTFTRVRMAVEAGD